MELTFLTLKKNKFKLKIMSRLNNEESYRIYPDMVIDCLFIMIRKLFRDYINLTNLTKEFQET